METVKMILENWVYFFILLILGLLTVYAILRFMKLTPKQQLEKVKVALLYMVTEAEKELKSKTGRIKRSMVWEWLVERFPIVTLFITEGQYDKLLDQALEDFRKMLESNTSLYDYVYNTVTVTEEDTENDIMRKIVTGAYLYEDFTYQRTRGRRPGRKLKIWSRSNRNRSNGTED